MKVVDGKVNYFTRAIDLSTLLYETLIKISAYIVITVAIAYQGVKRIVKQGVIGFID